jgi:hypothetical protein
MADLNDFNYVDDSDDVMAVHVNNLVAASMRSEYKNAESLSATRTLLDVDTPLQRFDCNGANRIVKMPTADTIENHPFLIVNSTSSGAHTLTIQSNDASVTHAVLNPSKFVLMFPDGDGNFVSVTSEVEDAIVGILDKLELHTTGGTSTAFTFATVGGADLEAGEKFNVKFHATAGSTPTLNRDSKGAKALKYYDSSGAKQAATSTQIVADMIFQVIYDGVDYVLLGTGSGGDTKLVQRVEGTPNTTYSSITTALPVDDSIPQNTEGGEVCTVTITPTSATNRLVIHAQFFGASDTALATVLALFKGTTTDALAARSHQAGAANALFALDIMHEMEAGTTSPVTFKLRAGNNAGATTYVNGTSAGRRFGGVAACRISVEEIKV